MLNDTDITKVEYKDAWLGFWHFYNIMQSASNSIAVNQKALDAHEYADLNL